MGWFVQVVIPVSALVLGAIALSGTPQDGEGLELVIRGYVGGVATMVMLVMIAILGALR